ncbi:hypothetical protein [Aliikangiella sp. IMCC44359]|uniref:hypothetical protein n=1 Tax=Aliikangiella sp. IMCC44359 TaxID=3459125 RepID=UPI00403AF8CB
MGRANQITVEVCNEDGAEFAITSNAGTEWHQVKSSNAGRAYSPKLVGGVLSKLSTRYKGGETVCFITKEDVGKIRAIADNVRNIDSYESLQSQGSQADIKSFNEFHTGLGISDPTVSFYWLRQTIIEQQSEQNLEAQIVMHASLICSGEPLSALDALQTLADSHLGNPIDETVIWGYLTSRGIKPTPQVKADYFNTLCANQLDAYSYSQSFDVLGNSIERGEVKTLVRHVSGEDSTITFVHAGAGAGKSSIVYQFINATADNDWSTLVFRVDRKSQLEALLREAAGGEQVTLVQAISQISQHQKVIVIIDQLDALSEVSGRHSEQFDEISPLIKQLAGIKNTHLIISCRSHDLQFDYRLRSLNYNFKQTRNESVLDLNVSPLSEDVVKTFLSSLGFDVTRIDSGTLKMIRNPSELSMFVQLIAELPEGDISFQNSNELLDEFWQQKRRDFEKRDNGINWSTAVSLVVQKLNQKQSLSVSERYFEESTKEIAALISSGILIKDHSNYVAFVHETLFDYAFARQQCAQDITICEWLQQTEQHLFQRGQLRQILWYLRTTDLPVFRESVSDILGHGNIRPHLKASVFQTLNLLSNPSPEDWELIRVPWCDSEHELSRIAVSATWAGKSWVEMFDEHDILKPLLSDTDNFVSDRAMSVLRSVNDKCPELIGKYALWIFENHPNKEREVSFILSRCTLTECPALIIPALKESIKRGLHDKQAQHSFESFWELIERKKGLSNETICDLINTYLSSLAERGKLQEQLHKIVHKAGEFIKELAKENPWEFMQAVLPIHIAIFNRYGIEGGGYDDCHSVWSGMDESKSIYIGDILIHSLAIALGNLCQSHPAEANTVTEQLLGTKTRTGKTIILMAAETTPSKAVVPIVLTLIQESSKDIDGDDFYFMGPYWTHALSAIASHLSTKVLRAFEDILMSIFPAKEYEHAKYQRYMGDAHYECTPIGEAQFALLYGLREANLSNAARLRLLEWERKFKSSPRLDRTRISVGWVGSPLPAIAHKKMSDQQWLAAMKKEWPDRWSRVNVEGHLSGGPEELARYGFIPQVSANPERFLSLFFKHFDETIPLTYWEAFIDGIREAQNVEPQQITVVCEKAIALEKSELHMSIARFLGSRTPHVIDHNGLEILGQLAIHSPDPEAELWRGDKDDVVYYGGEIEGHAINCVRGVAAEAIEQYFYEYPEKYDLVQQVIQAALSDKNIAVRSSIIGICPSLHHHKIVDGIGTFIDCIGPDLELTTTRSARHCFNQFLVKGWDRLRPLIEGMINSDIDAVAIEGSILMGFAWLEDLITKDKYNVCIEGKESHRIGIAKILVGNFKNEKFQEKCLELFPKMFDDESEKVRQEVNGFVRHLKDDDFVLYEPTLTAYLKSCAFDGDDMLFYSFERAVEVSPELLLTAADAMLSLNPDDLSDMRTAKPIGAETLSKLLLSAYNNTRDTDLKKACLDRIDALTLNAAYGLENALSEYNRD